MMKEYVQAETLFTVAFLHCDAVGPAAFSIREPIGCQDGSAIIAAVIELCEQIEFDPNDFEVNIEDLQDTSGFMDDNYVLLEPFGGGQKHVLVDIIVAKTVALRTHFAGAAS